MGSGYGRKYGPGYNSQPNVNETADSVRSEIDRWFASQGNPNIKVGEVKEKDANTITADISSTKTMRRPSVSKSIARLVPVIPAGAD